jgi:hypothetical protein
MTMVEGEILVDECSLTRVDKAEVLANATVAARELIGRAGI